MAAPFSSDKPIFDLQLVVMKQRQQLLLQQQQRQEPSPILVQQPHQQLDCSSSNNNNIAVSNSSKSTNNDIIIKQQSDDDSKMMQTPSTDRNLPAQTLSPNGKSLAAIQTKQIQQQQDRHNSKSQEVTTKSENHNNNKSATTTKIMANNVTAAPATHGMSDNDGASCVEHDHSSAVNAEVADKCSSKDSSRMNTDSSPFDKPFSLLEPTPARSSPSLTITEGTKETPAVFKMYNLKTAGGVLIDTTTCEPVLLQSEEEELERKRRRQCEDQFNAASHSASTTAPAATSITTVPISTCVTNTNLTATQDTSATATTNNILNTPQPTTTHRKRTKEECRVIKPTNVAVGPNTISDLTSNTITTTTTATTTTATTTPQPTTTHRKRTKEECRVIKPTNVAAVSNTISDLTNNTVTPTTPATTATTIATTTNNNIGDKSAYSKPGDQTINNSHNQINDTTKTNQQNRWSENYKNMKLDGIIFIDHDGTIVNFVVVKSPIKEIGDPVYRTKVHLDKFGRPILAPAQTFDQMIQAKRRQQMLLYPISSSSRAVSPSELLASSGNQDMGSFIIHQDTARTVTTSRIYTGRRRPARRKKVPTKPESSRDSGAGTLTSRPRNNSRRSVRGTSRRKLTANARNAAAASVSSRRSRQLRTKDECRKIMPPKVAAAPNTISDLTNNTITTTTALTTASTTTTPTTNVEQTVV